MIIEQSLFDHPLKNDLKTYNNIQKIATVQVDDFATDCFLDHDFFKNIYKMIAIDLSKQQALDVGSISFALL